MQTDETLIRQVKKMFEEKTGWGDSGNWTNQDFLQLSELIRDQTGVTLSHVTLKRVWGKVKYDSLPNTHTLNTLTQFLGYDNWRDFAVQHPVLPQHAEGATPSPDNATTIASPNNDPSAAATSPNNDPVAATSNPAGAAPNPVAGPQTASANQILTSTRPLRKKLWLLTPLVVILLVLLYLRGQQPPPQPRDYAFSSKKAVTSGLPNSVVFDYDATRSPDDSVVIQQSWDTTRRVKVSKNDHQHTSVYYYPDFYHATLQVHNRVVKTHNLLIQSNGWLPLVEQDPVPVYFNKEEAIHNGKMSITADQIKQKNIQLQPSPPTVMFSNVRDFGEIYSDHFVFETSLKNDYSEGSSVCQLSRIYLLCEGTAIWVPLCSKGCISTVDLFFTYFYTSGKREDLSNFGVNFDDYVKLRIESDSGKAKIWVNDNLAYTVKRHIIRSKIIGIMYRFQGTGSLDYVSLSNDKVSYRENFNQSATLP
ncbi:MAG TPA: hypothetical protein VL727_17325 [Puia sp.]|jgi:hypothetical protein|nr:hypothetical protein [Puia sp.]